MSYDEHLISQAGGDGDELDLDAIQERDGAVKAKAREIFEARYPNGAWKLVRGNDLKHYMHRARQTLTALESKP